jgi:hypothetical protein
VPRLPGGQQLETGLTQLARGWQVDRSETREPLAGLCFLALTVVLALLSYAFSHASGNAAVSVTFGFLAFYCAITGVLCLGRALTWGPKRLVFWVFLPRWLLDSQRSARQMSATSGAAGQRP